jgi:hypothetical protein
MWVHDNLFSSIDTSMPQRRSLLACDLSANQPLALPNSRQHVRSSLRLVLCNCCCSLTLGGCVIVMV